MKKYQCLTQQEFLEGDFRLVPIRFEDRYEIMKWRNEQIYHLRQKEPLTIEQQDAYFENVVAKLFDQKQPNQILFSFLKNEELIGYGGLVHINWEDRNAEVSFLMNTALEHNQFQRLWNIYLLLLKKVVFDTLMLQKTYVYAFDLRPHLYEALEEVGYFFDARLKEHCFCHGEFKDVVIYSLLNK